MKKTTLVLALIFMLCPAVFAVDITINTLKGKLPISPYIYGVNQDIAPDVKVGARRLGGNRMTGYNWENNASNAGSDWQHYSDNWLIEQYGGGGDEAGRLLNLFHEKSLTLGAYSLITLPLAGYVAKDKNGPVSPKEAAPSDRWAKVIFKKDKPFSLDPDKGDAFVYLDEEVNFLVNKYGKADTATGVKGYALDNEADIWPGTHPRIHPNKTGAEEFIKKSIEASEAIKAVDPAAEVFGPASYGFNGFRTWQDAPDYYQARWKYDWYLAYYIAMMKEASDKAGKRLLDVLDVHWYPEAQGNGIRVAFSQGKAAESAEARVQAPRSLWDEKYTEASWICSSGNCPIALIPKLKAMIGKYNPGTKIAFTEYEYGGGYHPSAGVAEADVLGIFGKYGIYMANYWMAEWGAYTLAAFRLYRNYDGEGSVYGDTNVRAKTSNHEIMTTYAATDTKAPGVLHVILINKDLANTQTARVKVTSKTAYKTGIVWGFDRASEGKITQRAELASVKGNSFSVDLPPLSAYHAVLSSKPKTEN